jgi:hypothetical protein
MIERLGGKNQALDAVGAQATAPDTKVDHRQLEDMRQNNINLNGNGIAQRAPSPRRVTAESSGDEFPIPSGQATDLVDPVGSLNLGHLSLEDGGRSRLVESCPDQV